MCIRDSHWRPFTYYAGRDLVAYQDELWLPNDDLDWRAQFAAASQGHPRIWLIWWRAHWGDQRGRVREMLDAQATLVSQREFPGVDQAVSYTHLRAHETVLDLVCRLLLEKKTTVLE